MSVLLARGAMGAPVRTRREQRWPREDTRRTQTEPRLETILKHRMGWLSMTHDRVQLASRPNVACSRAVLVIYDSGRGVQHTQTFSHIRGRENGTESPAPHRYFGLEGAGGRIDGVR